MLCAKKTGYPVGTKHWLGAASGRSFLAVLGSPSFWRWHNNLSERIREYADWKISGGIGVMRAAGVGTRLWSEKTCRNWREFQHIPGSAFVVSVDPVSLGVMRTTAADGRLRQDPNKSPGAQQFRSHQFGTLGA